MKSSICAAALLLAACGSQTPAENMSDRLDAAADQSTPAAADVLENAADAVEDRRGEQVNQTAERALQEAGNAQAPATATDR